MRVFEDLIQVGITNAIEPVGLINSFRDAVGSHLGPNCHPVRFVVSGQRGNVFECELGVVDQPPEPNRPGLFEFRRRSREDGNSFNVVFLVPTGIGAEFGGHSGDAGPIGRLLGSTCDHLITHPNVGNAADINELPSNALYVEGSMICDLLMGSIGLASVRANRLILLMERHVDRWFMDATVNMASAARAAAGIRVDEVVVMDTNFNMSSIYAASGRAAGIVEGIDAACRALDSRRDSFDAVAIASRIKVPPHYHKQYFDDTEDRMVNPWGGVEAMLTHTLSRRYQVPTAHAPMMTSREVQTLDFGPVDPRKAAEPVSATYLFSVLKGLHRSPRILSPAPRSIEPGCFTAENIHALVIPDGCIGLPTLAALAQGIPVIAVRGNRNCLKTKLDGLPIPAGGMIWVDNYLEAAGVLTAMRGGISIESVRRPLAHTRYTEETSD
jgi:hypothetical protein